MDGVIVVLGTCIITIISTSPRTLESLPGRRP